MAPNICSQEMSIATLGSRFSKSSAAWAEPTERGRQLGLREGWGLKQPIAPLFAAADASAEETLATWSDGSAAVALRQTADGWSLFVGPPGLTSGMLRLAARRAGVHLFTHADCNVYANGPYLALHAAQDGPLEIDTGCDAEIRDLLSGQRIGHGPRAALTLKKGDTRVLQIAEPRCAETRCLARPRVALPARTGRMRGVP